MAEKAVNGRGTEAPSQGVAAAQAKPGAGRSASRRIQVRRSGVHGKGVFALQRIAEGETIIEYVGEQFFINDCHY